MKDFKSAFYNSPYLLSKNVFDFEFDKNWTINKAIISPKSTRAAILYEKTNIAVKEEEKEKFKGACKRVICLFKVNLDQGLSDSSFIPMYLFLIIYLIEALYKIVTTLIQSTLNSSMINMMQRNF